MQPLSSTFRTYLNHWTLPLLHLDQDITEFKLHFIYKTPPPKIKDCQVVQTRISREHGGRDHKTELQVGGVAETQLYKVTRADALNDFISAIH